jgi:outer membrane protein TolC
MLEVVTMGRTLCAALFTLIPFLCHGMETVSFPEALEMALERHNLVRAAGHELRAASFDRQAVTSRYLPTVRLEEGFASSNAPTRVFMMKLDQGRFTDSDFLINNLNDPSSTTDFSTALVAELPLFDLSLGALRRMALHQEEARGAVLAKRREDVALALVAAYVEVEKARAHRQAASIALEQAREHQRLARVRSDTGTGLKSDELRARTFAASMEERLITAENRMEIAAMGLALAAGEGPDSRLDAGEPLQFEEGQLSLHGAMELALANRQDLREADAVLARGEEGVALARSAWYPTVHASARYQMNDEHTPFGSDNDAWSMGATLRWELFDGLRRRGEGGAAGARRDAAREYLEEMRRQVVFTVTQRFLERDGAMRRRQVARHALEDAAETVRLLEKRYANSLAGMVDLLDAQAAYNSSRATLIDLEGDCQLAVAGLYHAAGVLLAEVRP